MKSKKYINWVLERTDNKKVEIVPRDNDICWEDLITKSSYCISRTIYEQIFEAGCQKIRELLEKDNLEEISKIYYNSSKLKGKIALFPLLPLIHQNKTYSIRICDYISLRTALLYVVKYEELNIEKSKDADNIKRRIRLDGLTWRYGKEQKDFSELGHIDKILFSSDSPQLDLSKCLVDVVKGGLVKIKQYYLETDKIPEIRGASLLLDIVNNEIMRNYVCQEHIRECIVYTGGGKMLGIFPKGTGKSICKGMEQLVENATVTAQSNFCSFSCTIKNLTTSYKKIMDEIDLLLEEQQGLRWDYKIEPNIENSEILDSRNVKYKILTENDDIVCESCRHRNALFELVNIQNKKLCQSCLHKNLHGGREAKESMFKKYQNYVRKKYSIEIANMENRYNNLAEIAEKSNGFIGVIYGDANNMSYVINEMDSLMKMKYFSEKTADIVTEIVFDALYTHLREIPSFEIIAVGGDDIFILVPGNKAYDIACTIGENFDEDFSNHSNHQKNMTMSVGVCITHAQLPVQYSFDIVQKLLKSAKQKAWEEQQSNHLTGTIDWMVIENDIAGSSILEYQRENIPNKPEKTLRPYTWKQAYAMKNFIHQIEDEKSFAFQLKQSWYYHETKESALFYEYQIARKKIDKNNVVKNAYKDMASLMEGEVKQCNVCINGKIYTPWIDVIELWDYI